MAQIVASSFSKVIAAAGTSSFPVSLPTGVTTGDIIVVTATTFTADVTLSSSDMTALISQTTSGTLISMQWWHNYQGVAPSVDTVFPGERGVIVHVLVLRGAGTPITGTVSSRPAQGGDGLHTTALGMTAAESGALGLAFFTERTSAAETSDQVTVASPWTKEDYAYDTLSSGIETITIASQATTSGTTVDAVATYPNFQASNGTGWQLSVPTVIIPPQPTPNHPVVVTSSVTSANSGTASVTSLAVPTPSGIVAGDYLVATLHNQSASASTFDTPSGWTKLGELVDPTPSGYRRNCYFGYSVTDSGAVPANVTFSVASDAGRMTGFMAIVKQVDHADPVGAVSTISDITDVATTTLSLDSLPLQSDSSLVLLAVHVQQSAAHDNPLPFTTAPVSMAQYGELITNEPGQTSTVSRTASTLLGADADTSMTFPATTTTFAAAVDNRTALAIELKYAPQASPEGDGWSVYDGTGQPALLYYADAIGQPRTPSYLTTMPPGYPSVAAMLAEPLFFVAHRGGSRNFPEHSLHAYTQSVARGYRALELALARTSDGVYFGLHDASLDRTSLGTAGNTLNPEAMTWAEVQAYSILPPNTAPSQPSRPYMRWEEIIAAYGSTHILFIDPKVVNSQYHDTVLNMMDALPGATDRMVAKFFGVSGGASNTGWAKKASDRGYQTWGYFYQADSANFAAYQGRWSILGMEHGADQATWNTILSYGKPVIGHVIPSMAAAQSAVTKGAAGLMVSEVVGIDPATAPGILLP